jgi:hypothetical protein
MRGGKEADDVGLVHGLAHAPQRRSLDVGLALLGRTLLPARANALGQRGGGRDGVDVDAVGSELVGKLRRQRDDAALAVA